MILRFMAIKSLNSSLAERLQKSREQHENDKANVDRLKLKSANLNYKREHLVRDVELCKTLLTPSLSIVEKDIGKKLGVTDFSDNLDSLHDDALEAMAAEIGEREQAEAKYEKLNTLFDAGYNRYDKKRKFLEQDAPAHLEKIKELMESMNDDFVKYLEKEKDQQKVLTGDGDEEEEEDEDDEEEEGEGEGEGEGDEGVGQMDEED